MSKKPISQLKELLAWLGLDLPLQRKEQSGKTKRYLYGLDPDRLQAVRNWVAARRDPHRSESWRAQRDHETSSGGKESIPGNPADISDPLDRLPQERAQPSEV